MVDQHQNRIFVSYSHKDKIWLERVQVHLRPLIRNGVVDLWDDTRISPGSMWREDIRASMQSAKIAVFLISADFLASDFINSHELPALLLAAQQRGVRLLSIILSPCGFADSPLGAYQSINPMSRSLINMGRGDQEEVFTALASFVKLEFQSASEPKTGPVSMNAVSSKAAKSVEHIENMILLGQFEQADQEASSILKLQPNNVEALLARTTANAYIFKKEEQVVRDAALALILSQDRTDTTSLLQYANALFLLHYIKKSVEYASKVIEIEPSNKRAYRTRMLANIRSGKNYDAIADASWLLNTDSSDGYAWYRMSHAYLNLKNYDNAIQCADNAIRCIPNYWIIYDRRGSAHSSLGHQEEALKDFSRVLEKAPWYNSSRRMKAAILTDMKRYPEALVEIALALMFEPEDAAILAMQAEAFLNLGDYANAKKAADTALKYDPNDNFAKDVLARLPSG